MPLRIIYIDDEPDICALLKDCFSSAEVIIETYSDPQEGLEAVNRNPPDVLFLDYRMGAVTGDDIAAKVAVALPKVLITGDLTVHPREKFDWIFHKPFKMREIRNLIDAYCQMKIPA